MAYQVIWSEPALQDLRHIYDFISSDSPRYADAQVRKLLASVRRLEEFPFSGRIAANLSRDDVREIIVVPYILMYQIDEKLHRVEVKLITHGSRRKY